jgi:hypothetical protein
LGSARGLRDPLHEFVGRRRIAQEGCDSAIDPMVKWVWQSISPGVTNAPCRSMTCVRGLDAARTASLPMATICPPATPMASVRTSGPAPVHTAALT